jgi:predicted CXXCH cytochrome family protein
MASFLSSFPPRRIHLFFVALFVLAACVDESVVYDNRPIFGEPDPAALGFVGYSDRDAKRLVCGSCHVGRQAEWTETGHADAWEGLQSSGSAQEFCETCHTTNSRGNVMSEPAGYDITMEARYHDVQCESCHGPGVAHLQLPDVNRPQAPLSAGSDLSLGCGECHQGTHHPFVNEWEQSKHAEVVGFAADRVECTSCHSGEGALAAWGFTTAFLEQDDVGPGKDHLSITCGICHDPHGSDLNAQLRFPIDTPNEEANLCMKCHNRRGTPDPGGSSGPHAPEAAVVIGYGGWWPPSLEFPGDTIFATHGSEANPRICAGCHVNAFTVTDPETGGFVFNATGHTFESTPCLNEQGVPVPGDCDAEEQSYGACTASGCHTTEDRARELKARADTRTGELAVELAALLDQVPDEEFDPNDGRYTIAEGAKFNLDLRVEYPGSTTHNPFLMEALLLASIKDVEEEYELSASTSMMLHRILGQD